MPELHEYCRRNIDGVLLVLGLLFLVGVPAMLWQQTAQTRNGVPVLLSLPFMLLGVSCLIVGVRGLAFNAFASIDERRAALLFTFVVLCGGLFAAVLGLFLLAAMLDMFAYGTSGSSRSSPSGVDPVRGALACVGGVAGFYLAASRPPVSEAKAFWSTVLCAGAAWFAAYIVFGIVLAIGVAWLAMKFFRPHLTEITTSFLHSRRQLPGPTQGQDQRIADLKQQVDWTRNSSAPEQYRNEEIARLQKQIRDFGGTP